MNKLERDFLFRGYYHLFAPWETTWIRFNPISPWAREEISRKWGGPLPDMC